MTPQEKQAARDKIAALRAKWERAHRDNLLGSAPPAIAYQDYVRALESLVDELTAPEPEGLESTRAAANAVLALK